MSKIPHKIIINNIQGTKNLFALKDSIKIEFSPDLSVVYGANGSGKTSLVKILSHANRKNVELAKNQFKKKKEKQDYVVEYNLDSIDQKTTLTEKSTIELDIFDDERGNRLLSGDNELSVESEELLFLTELSEYVDDVKASIKRKSNQLQEELQKITIPTQYENTDTKQMLDDFYEKEFDDAKKLINNIEWTEEDQGKLNRIIAELDMENHERKLKDAKTFCERVEKAFNELSKISTAFIDSEYDEVKKQKEKLKSDIRAAKEYSDKIFSQAVIGEVGSETWKKMWEAARAYSELAYSEEKFPVVDNKAVCVLCHQPLSEDAKKRMCQFEEYIKSSFEKEIEDDLEVLNGTKLLILKTDNIVIEPELEFIYGVENKRKYSAAVCKMKEISIWQNEQKRPETEFRKIDTGEIKKIEEDLKKLLTAKREEAANLESDSERSKLEKAQIQLESKKWLVDKKASLLKYISDKETLNVYSKTNSITSTIKLTNKSKEISESILTENYAKEFNHTLALLGANDLHAKLVSGKAAKGRGSFKIVLENDDQEMLNTKDVLSTGECRVISLAAFIADGVNKNDNVPFIFDDPVSSLDGNYEEQVAKALKILAEQRQVIVFTHRLSMVSALLDDKKAKLIEISRNGPVGCGVPDYEPVLLIAKTSDLKKSLKNLKEKVNELDKQAENGGAFDYNALLSGLKSKFRTLVEDSIEVVILDCIVMRFRKSVYSQKVKKLAEISRDDCTLIDDLMTKYSSEEHSQSPEAAARKIESKEFLQDIDKLIDMIKKY